MGAHLETAVTVQIFCAAELTMCVKHPRYRIGCFYIFNQSRLQGSEHIGTKLILFLSMNSHTDRHTNTVVVHHKLVCFADLKLQEISISPLNSAVKIVSMWRQNFSYRISFIHVKTLACNLRTIIITFLWNSFKVFSRYESGQTGRQTFNLTVAVILVLLSLNVSEKEVPASWNFCSLLGHFFSFFPAALRPGAHYHYYDCLLNSGYISALHTLHLTMNGGPHNSIRGQ